MAHGMFEPAAKEDVQFKRTVAKDGKVKKPDPLWTNKFRGTPTSVCAISGKGSRSCVRG